MRLLITKEEAMERLAPYHETFFDVVDLAWGNWRKDHAPKFASPRRALQVCMNELMEQDIRMRLGSDVAVRLPPPHPESNRFWLEFPSAGLTVFLKKFRNGGYQISNYPTATAEQFNGQQILQGVPDLPRVTLGYFVTTTGHELAGTHVAFLLGKKVQWHYELRSDPGRGKRGVVVVPDYPNLPLRPAALVLKAGAKSARK